MNKLLLSICMAATTAHAEITEVNIPGKGWGIRFDMPVITEYQGVQAKSGFQYMAVSKGSTEKPQTILSFFLEQDANSSNKECFNSYWAKTKRVPMVVTPSVKLSSLQGYEQASYRYIDGTYHANFYFVAHGYCIDVHVSSSPSQTAEESLLAIGKSLSVFP